MAGRNYQKRRSMVKFSSRPARTSYFTTTGRPDKAIASVADEKRHEPLDANTNSIAVMMDVGLMLVSLDVMCVFVSVARLLWRGRCT